MLPNRGLYTTFSNIDAPVRNDVDSITGNIDIDLSDTITLSSVTGYIKNKESVTQDFDGSSANFFETRRQQKYHQFSQELRLLAEFSDSINLLVGGYYFDSGYTLDQSTNFGVVLGQGADGYKRQSRGHAASPVGAPLGRSSSPPEPWNRQPGPRT